VINFVLILGVELKREGRQIKDVMADLKELLRKDHHFGDGRILSSMCTSPHKLAVKAHMQFMEANLGNPDLYPGTKQLEKEVIRILSELFHGQGLAGHMTSGGTEANITALWIARKLSGKREVLFPKSVHFSIIKAIDLLNMVPVEVDLDDDYKLSMDDLEKKVTKDTAAVVGMAGTTELGVIDPIEKISEFCSEKLFLHVDAAFGGFVIPFLNELGAELPNFDFTLNGVSSLNTDPHKMGFSTIPSGVLLYRDEKYLDRITVDAPYLISMKHTTLTGTKASAAVAATYAVLTHLGREGFKNIVKQCMDNTYYLESKVNELGLELAIKPIMNIMGIRLKNPTSIQKKLARLNWFVSKSRFPNCLRIVLMPHVNREVLDKFLPIFERVCRDQGEL
jgi:tyrosine decarboxylase/aspartate 1-decarboxylase